MMNIPNMAKMVPVSPMKTFLFGLFVRCDAT